uniref:Protein kinase domain-containing protein n=1 Tax=Salmo trutta TaxID=8032 RepID=A0A674AFD6_SALTR
MLTGTGCTAHSTLTRETRWCARTHVKLEGLEDCRVLEGDDDILSDTHGCPAYVSPEILNSSSSYSGKQADVWSLGVMLYTILVGRYPFHDPDPATLFSKIRRGQCCLPEGLFSPGQVSAALPAEERTMRQTDRRRGAYPSVVPHHHRQRTGNRCQ